MDDFGVKYERQDDVTHLIEAQKKIQDIWGLVWQAIPWTNIRVGLLKRSVLVSMPNYVTKALHKFQHPNPRRSQYAPHQCTRPKYGATNQLVTPLDNSPLIPEERKRRIQQIVGTFLYYAGVVYCAIIPDPNTIA